MSDDTTYDDYENYEDAPPASGDGDERQWRSTAPSDPGPVRIGNRRSRGFYRETVERLNGKIDYKDVETLRYFITEHGKIRPRRQTGVSAKEQRAIAKAVKRARHMALLPYTDDQLREVS